MDKRKQIQQPITNAVALHKNYTTFTYMLHRRQLYKTIGKQKLYLKHWMLDKYATDWHLLDERILCLFLLPYLPM